MTDRKQFLLELADLMDNRGITSIDIDVPALDPCEATFGPYLGFSSNGDDWVVFPEDKLEITPTDLRQKAEEL